MHLGLPHDASIDGFRIDRLIALGAAIQIPLLLLLVLWLVASLRPWRRPAKLAGELAPVGRGLGGWVPHGLPAVVSSLALVLLVAEDAVSWVQSNRDLDDHLWNFAAAEANPATVRIEVDAHQWAWLARYPGPDGVFDTADDAVTLDDFRVPVGAPVLLELTSTDVIHDFYLPNFRIKQDVVPGRVTRLMFTAKETGEFEIACSQYCGVNHYKMRALLEVLPESDYRRWAQSASANSQAGYDPEDRGAHWGWPWVEERVAP